MLDVHFWQTRYQQHDTPWDLGGPSPHWVPWLAQSPAWLKPGNMAVLGAGRGHDAAFFAGQGFQVVGFDYAEAACEAARTYYPSGLFVQADILLEPAANEALRPWLGQMDYVLEHTCFCAISPSGRPAYVKTAQALLKPGGYLLGVFWEHGESDGPPFSVTQEALRGYFQSAFDWVESVPCVPAAGRTGVEYRVVLRRKKEVSF